MVPKKFPVVPIKFKIVLKLNTILPKGFKVVPNHKNTVKKKFKLAKKIRYCITKIQNKY